METGNYKTSPEAGQAIKPGNQLFPVFLKLSGLNVLLVGAGNVGLEKLQALLTNSPQANVTIVAPRVRDEVRSLANAHPSCIIRERAFLESDLDNIHLVICATDNRQLHVSIKELAAQKRLLVNVADTPDLCDFYLGSIVKKGNLKIAISTSGKSPTIAKRVREVIGDLVPEEIDALLDNMQAIRNSINGSFEDKVRKLNEITKDLVTKSNHG